jgi:glutaconate CoA-transferase, subunit A
MPDKLVPLSDAVAAVNDGAHLTFGGFGHALTPMAFVRELVRRGPRQLELSAIAECWAVDMLAGANCISRARFSNVMFEGLGRCRNFSRRIEAGVIETEDYSHLGLVSRMAAAGQGLPFATIHSMMDSDLERVSTFDRPKSQRLTDPYSDREVLLLPPLRPEIAVVHAARVDRDGNAQLFGTSSAIEEQTFSADIVIVTAEEIVSSSVIRSEPALTLVPGFLVDAVVWTPYGSHPTGMFRYYGEDQTHIAEYYEASRAEDLFTAYLERWVYGLDSQWEYLDRLGSARLMALRADPALGRPL